MDLHTETYSFQKLLVLKKKYIVPRYQREFSWGKVEIDEMYNDIFKRLKFDSSLNKFSNTEYFFGNILLQGDLTGSKQELYIIDGQQRLTALTIFLSVLAKKFGEASRDDLKNAVWNYVVSKDDDGKEFAVFANSTPFPYFQYKVQCLNIEEREPCSEEEDRIKYAYDFFDKTLSPKAIKKSFKNYFHTEIDYVEALKLLRDQMLQSYVICSWTADSQYANLIFEIMNAKGKELETIDLIKNDIFDKLDTLEPVDFAREEWKTIHDNLAIDGLKIPFTTFYRHFWNSQYGKTAGKHLWSKYKREIKNKEQCQVFLSKMVKFSKYYSIIIKPSLSNFKNRRELQYIVDGLNNITNELNVDMPRIFLLNAYDKYLSGLITNNQFGMIVKYLLRFHFIYNAVCSYRTNKLDGIYCSKSVDLKNAFSKEDCSRVIEELKRELSEKLPDYNYYLTQLTKLKYSSAEKLLTNDSVKIFLNEVECLISKDKNNKINSSIEHILNEDINNSESLNLNRLILLEMRINNSIPKIDILAKINYYKESTYSSVEQLVKRLEQVDTEEEAINILDEHFNDNSKILYNSVK